MRLTLALLAAAAAAAAGAVILGEYRFDGVTVIVTGVVFGLLLAELAVAINRRTSLALGAALGAIAAAAMAWAGWIASGHDFSFVGPAGWTAVVLAGAAAGLRAGWSRRAAGTAPEAREPGSAPENRPA